MTQASPFGLQFGDKKKVMTREGWRWVAEADPTPDYSAAWKADKEALRAKGFSWSKSQGGTWKAVLWEKDEEAEAKSAQSQQASRAAEADIDLPCPPGLRYLPFQKAGVAFALERDGTLIGDEMGLGKTIQAIAYAGAIGARRIMVGCPASLKQNWYNEIKKWQIVPATVYVISTGVKMPIGVELPDGWWVVSWEVAQKFERQLKTNARWDLVIIDECHKLKTATAQRTRFFLGGRVRDPETNGYKEVPPIKATKRLALTGTPICNRPLELWPFIHWLDPKRWKSITNFKRRYCAAHYNGYGTDADGASNLDELQRLLRESVMIRRLKSQVLKDLPAKQRQVIALDIQDGDYRARQCIEEELSMHDRYEREVERASYEKQKAEAEGDEAAYKTAVSKLRAAQGIAFTEMSRVRHQTALAKVAYVIEHLNDLDEERKVVCFAHHNDVCQKIYDAMRPRGALLMTQATKIEERQALVHRFQGDPNIKVIVLTIGVGGVGFTLTASSHVVFAELDWVPGNVSQCEDRCHRIGARDSVLVQHLVFDGSLDGKMAKTLVDKQEVIDRALDRETKEPVQSDAAIEHLSAVERPINDIVSDEPVERKKAVPLTPAQISAVHRALQVVAGYDADRARQINGVGFSKMDTGFGCELAKRAWLTPRQAEVGARMVRKYRRQYSKDLYQQIFGEVW